MRIRCGPARTTTVVSLPASVPSIRAYAIWSVVSQFENADMERFARWLDRACDAEVPAEPGPLHACMNASLKMNLGERRELQRMLVAAIEERLS